MIMRNGKRDASEEARDDEIGEAERETGLGDEGLGDEERDDDAADGLGGGEDAPEHGAVSFPPPLGEQLGGGQPGDALHVPRAGPQAALHGEPAHHALEGQVADDGSREAHRQQPLGVHVVGSHPACHLPQ